MAPVINNRKRNKQIQANKNSIFELKSLMKLAKNIFLKTKYIQYISIALLLAEFVINFFIISFVKYTEIDWGTYMQQVECFLNGTLNYENISGDTGPIVYPAGHLYVYTLLYYLTNAGKNLKIAQIIFAILYLANLYVIHRIYYQYKFIPAYVYMLISFTSYRVHSLFVLRLFNDAIAMFFLYLSVYLFIQRRWSLGCAIFSFAVSIKMNILLFAPALFILLVEYCSILDVIKNLFICAVIQLVFAAPFLTTYPVSYIRCSFNLGRIFIHKWTVNWRFLPEELFVSRNFHLTLLSLHFAVLLFIFRQRWSNAIVHLYHQCLKREFSSKFSSKHSSPAEMIVTLFTANLIGIAFSRSLHYQFYLWYYHTIPFLLWSTNYRITTKLCMWGVIELSWKIYPSTYWSSSLLHLIHLTLIIGLWNNRHSNGIVILQNNPNKNKIQ